MNGLFIILTMITVCQAEVQLLDYTHSQLIMLDQGQARLQNGNFKLIHSIDLITYEHYIDTIQSEIQHKVLRNSTILPFLLHDIKQLREHIGKIKPRNKRSIDALGTLWKWIAGTPDHQDHQIITNQVNGLLRNNDRQRIINKNIFDKINTLTTNTNIILKTVQSLSEVQRTIEETVTNKLRIIKEEIVNIDYALQWAKVGVINSFILSEKEIDEAKTFLDSEKFPYNNVEEALGFATVKIATNGSSIIYVISLPAVTDKNCKKLLIKPIKKNNTIIKIEYENLIRCKTKIFGIKENCIELNQLCICNPEKLLDLSTTKCIPRLLTSKNHDCIYVNNQHVPSVQLISPGIIFLNQFTGNIGISENKLHNVSGTYLIRFHNETITIANRTFFSKEESDWQPLPSILQGSSQNNISEEILSLQLIKELNTINIEKLESINFHKKIAISLNLCLTIILAILFLIYLIHRRRQNATINISASIIEEPKPKERKPEPGSEVIQLY